MLDPRYGPLVYTIYTPYSPPGARTECRGDLRDVYVIRHQLGRRIAVGYQYTELVAVIAREVRWRYDHPTFEQALALDFAAAVCVRKALEKSPALRALATAQSPES